MPRTVFALALLAAAAAAQTSFVVPSGLANSTGNSSTNVLFAGPEKNRPVQPVHAQLIYNTADIPIAGGPLKSMSFRRANYSASLPANPAASVTLALSLSVGPNAEMQVSESFAANVGSNATQVFNGTITLPPEAYSGPGPGPFWALIPFQAPFLYIQSMGPALVADFQVTVYTPLAPATDSWLIDAQTMPQSGAHAIQGPSQVNCKSSTGGYCGAFGSAGLYGPGAPWSYTLGNSAAMFKLLPNAPGVMTYGTQGNGTVWNGLSLPFDLAPLGAPGCFWSTNIVLAIPIQVDATGVVTVRVRVPNDPFLIGATFFDQGAIVDPAANALGLVTLWSSRWTVGTSRLPGGALVSKMLDSAASPTGNVSTTAVAARFTF